MSTRTPDFSVVIPVYNEEGSVRPLLDELSVVLDRIDRPAEIVAVDDGSTDRSFAQLAALAVHEPRLRVVRLARNYGQTAALAAGIEHARAPIIVSMDADLQNDPADIPRLLAALGEDVDVVNGWRAPRRDPWLTRRLPSQLANRLISLVTGTALHDYGCTLRAMRTAVARELRLYGEMHRFIPALAADLGAHVVEVPVHHRPRTLGRSKYGLSRTFKVVLDLMVVKFLASFATKPVYVFGGFGLLSFACAAAAFLWALYYKVAGLKDFVETPLPLVTVMFTLVGALSLLMGLLAELMVRTYYESQGKRPYLIAEELNRPEKPLPRAVGH